MQAPISSNMRQRVNNVVKFYNKVRKILAPYRYYQARDLNWMDSSYYEKLNQLSIRAVQ